MSSDGYRSVAYFVNVSLYYLVRFYSLSSWVMNAYVEDTQKADPLI